MLEHRLFQADTWKEGEELIGVNLCHTRGERTGTTIPTKKGKLHWYEVYETRCQLKISLGTAWKETWIIYPLATCSVEHKGPKAVGFPCHMPQNMVNPVTGHCLTFQCVNGDGDLWANTRTGDSSSFGEALLPSFAAGLFCKMTFQKIGTCIVHLWSELVCPTPKGFWEPLSLILMDTCLNYHPCKISLQHPNFPLVPLMLCWETSILPLLLLCLIFILSSSKLHDPTPQ